MWPKQWVVENGEYVQYIVWQLTVLDEPLVSYYYMEVQ